jgi:hypothetical protein
MDHRNKIQVELIKLVGGARLMRLTYSPLDLVLERQLDVNHALSQQQERLFGVFEAALAQAKLTAG